MKIAVSNDCYKKWTYSQYNLRCWVATDWKGKILPNTVYQYYEYKCFFQFISYLCSRYLNKINVIQSNYCQCMFLWDMYYRKNPRFKRIIFLQATHLLNVEQRRAVEIQIHKCISQSCDVCMTAERRNTRI